MPSRLTACPGFTVWSGPASAVSNSGVKIGPNHSTVMSTVSVSISALSPPTVTDRVNVSVTSAVRPDGAVKLGVAVVAPVSVTAGLPPVWRHE